LVAVKLKFYEVKLNIFSPGIQGLALVNPKIPGLKKGIDTPTGDSRELITFEFSASTVSYSLAILILSEGCESNPE
jgi:hypothetical protein